MKKTVLTVLAVVLSANLATAAVNSGSGTSEGSDTGASFATNVRRSLNKNHTVGDSTTDSNGWRKENQGSTSLKKSASATKTNDLSTSVNAVALFSMVFKPLENNPEFLDSFPQKRLVQAIKRKPFSQPVKASDVGITAETSPGQFDNAIREILHHAGGSQPELTTIHFPELKPKRILNIGEDYLYVGAIGWQALRHIQRDIALSRPELKAGKKINDTTKKKGVYAALKTVTDEDIRELGEADMQLLFLTEICRVLNEGIVDGDIQAQLAGAISSLRNNKCYLKSNSETILCGDILWNMHSPTEIKVGAAEWIGKGFGGMEVSWRISNSTSYAENLDRASTVNTTSNVAHEFLKRIDNNVAKGKGLDVITDLKNGVTATRNATTNNSVGK